MIVLDYLLEWPGSRVTIAALIVGALLYAAWMERKRGGWHRPIR